jgi:formylglycine-generating enzyme required for sulfatase activity
MKRWLFLIVLSCVACHKERRSPTADAPAPVESAARTSQAPTFVNTAAGGGSACNPACNALERCDNARCVPHCPDGEVYIPATGPEGFTMGRGSRFSFDAAHKVILTKPFCMDETEVTVAKYRECFDAGKCTVPQLLDANSNFRTEFHRPDHPINMVNFEQAKHYCEIHGESLPTEAQWEWAAGHGDGRKYAWGNTPEPTCENRTADFTPGGAPKVDPAGDVGCHGGGSSKVKTHLAGNSVWPDGPLYDIGGNLWEWTNDCYVAYPDGTVTDPSPQNDPRLGGDCYVRSLRGGAWNRSKQALVVAWRAGSKRTYRVPGLGFRCVRNPG